jgi:phospholipid/cholesterol/gamma-HCH transport system permease protein
MVTETEPDPPAPDLREVASPDGVRRVEVVGAWNLLSLQYRLAALVPRVRTLATDPALYWDLSGIHVLDHAGALVLWQAWGRRRAPKLIVRPVHDAVFRNLEFPIPAPEAAPPADPLAFVAMLGRGLVIFGVHLRDIVTLLGRVILDAVYLARHPGRFPWREFSASINRTGAQALGITALVGFLIGVTLSYLSSNQLKNFGADVFIVNILGMSVIRELGPMLAAVLIAGRSGSAMTAQLGVMRVTEELDAMAVMGIPHSLRLVLPKMLALAIAMPLIVLWTDAMALMGGMLSAKYELGITLTYFLDNLPSAVPIANLWLGLGKGVVFGFLIALIACHFGMRIEPNTESLGVGTTNSVVTSITVVIIVDAIFAILYRNVGLTV